MFEPQIPATNTASRWTPSNVRCIEQEALGFLGCEVVRTALGLAFERSLRLEETMASRGTLFAFWAW